MIGTAAMVREQCRRRQYRGLLYAFVLQRSIHAEQISSDGTEDSWAPGLDRFSQSYPPTYQAKLWISCRPHHRDLMYPAIDSRWRESGSLPTPPPMLSMRCRGSRVAGMAHVT